MRFLSLRIAREGREKRRGEDASRPQDLPKAASNLSLMGSNGAWEHALGPVWRLHIKTTIVVRCSSRCFHRTPHCPRRRAPPLPLSLVFLCPPCALPSLPSPSSPLPRSVCFRPPARVVTRSHVFCAATITITGPSPSSFWCVGVAERVWDRLGRR